VSQQNIKSIFAITYVSSAPLRNRNRPTCVQGWSDASLVTVAIFFVLLTNLLKVRTLPIFAQLLGVVGGQKLGHLPRLACVGKHALQLFGAPDVKIPPHEPLILRHPVVVLLQIQIYKFEANMHTGMHSHEHIQCGYKCIVQRTLNSLNQKSRNSCGTSPHVGHAPGYFPLMISPIRPGTPLYG